MDRPTLYLLYGDDPLALREAVDSLRARLGASAELNLQRFQAAGLDLSQLQQACQALPFLGDRRLVIVEGAEQLPTGAEFVEALQAQLQSLPDSTALVFVAALDRQQRSAAGDFERRSPVYRWATAHPEVSYLRQFAQPTGPALARWLVERAAQHGVTLEPQAADLLASLVDQDLPLADQELRKLADYAEPGGLITAAAVEQLTPIYGQTDIFEVVDGLASGGGSLAKLHRLLQEQDPGYVFLMVARQFRLLLQARHALDQSRDPVERLDVPAFVARKVASQARSFNTQALESFYRRLVALESAAKRGEADLSLDLIPLLASFEPVH